MSTDDDDLDERIRKFRAYIAKKGGLKSRDPTKRFEEAFHMRLAMLREENGAVERMRTALTEIFGELPPLPRKPS